MQAHRDMGDERDAASGPMPAPAAAPPAWLLSAGELSQAYASGRLSPVEVLESIFERIARLDPQLNAFAALDHDGARAAATASAARWAQGTPRSALDGVPVSIKDNIVAAGLPCRWGSVLEPADVRTHDETPVARLRDAGAVIFGKTCVPEYTLIGYCSSPLTGVTRNPWHLDRTPGGSSGGAVAAVAAGLGPLALGTDGGGSIRRPCGLTGLVGLKPSWGAVEREGGLRELLPHMEVAGPIARTVDDLVLAMQLLAPADPDVASLRGPRELPTRRIVQWRSIGSSPVDPAVAQSTDAMAERLRAMGHEVVVQPAPPIVERFNAKAWPVIATSGLAQVLPGSGAEAALSAPMAVMLQQGRRCTAAQREQAMAVVRELRLVMQALFVEHDLILTPSSAAPAWAADETHPGRIDGQAVGPRGHAVFTAFANATGLPALALPSGFDAERLPLGVQLVGRLGDDAALCALGLNLQAGQAPYRFPALTAPRADARGARA